VGRSLVANPFTYTGRWLDDESGLMYYNARVYNPTLGRFVQQDPMGVLATSPTELVNRGAAFAPVYAIPGPKEEYGDGLNLYQYVESNPLIRTDATGKFSLPSMMSNISMQAWLGSSSLLGGAGGFMGIRHVVNALAYRNAFISSVLNATSRMPGRALDILTRANQILQGTAGRVFTSNTYRQSYEWFMGLKLPTNIQVHHIFPNSARLAQWFASKGININLPTNLMEISETAHRLGGAHIKYTQLWLDFRRTYPNASIPQILEFARTTMQSVYNIATPW